MANEMSPAPEGRDVAPAETTAVHVLCMSSEGQRLAKPLGPHYMQHAVLEFLALAKALGAAPCLLPHGDDEVVRALEPADAPGLTGRLRNLGPQTLSGLTLAQGVATGARLVGLDLCVLLHAASSMEALLAQPPPQPQAWGGAGGAPYHLLLYAWGSSPSHKIKRRWLDSVPMSGLPGGLGCGRRLGSIGRAKLYQQEPGVWAGPEPEPESETEVRAAGGSSAPVLLSLLLVYDPIRRGQHGEKGVLTKCLLVAEAGGGSGLCGHDGLFGTLQRYRITARPHGGATPIQPELAFVMSNLAGLSHSSSVVLDPYAGTGSLLLPAAHWGLSPYGGDVQLGATNGELVVGRHGGVQVRSQRDHCGEGAPGSGVSANFRHLGLPPPQLVQANIFRSPWTPRGVYDAVVADPPYGTREQQVGTESAIRDTRIGPSGTSQCYVSDYTGAEMVALVFAMVEPLLKLAAAALKPGGRLVYLFPTFSTQASVGYWDPGAFGGEVALKESQLPGHVALRFESVSHQPCVSRTMARNVVVMVRR